MYKHSFDRVAFTNRWAQKYPPDDWTILGFAKRWFGPTSYEYKVCFFGFDLHIWIDRIWHPQPKPTPLPQTEEPTIIDELSRADLDKAIDAVLDLLDKDSPGLYYRFSKEQHSQLSALRNDLVRSYYSSSRKD